MASHPSHLLPPLHLPLPPPQKQLEQVLLLQGQRLHQAQLVRRQHLHSAPQGSWSLVRSRSQPRRQ